MCVVHRWFVLVGFVLHAFVNQFMFMEFSSIAETTKKVLSVDDAGVDSLYTASLAAAVPAVLGTMMFNDSHNYITTLFGVAATVGAAWIQYFAVVQSSYIMAVASSVALGLGIGTIFVGFTAVPAQWFTDEKERAIAMAAAVQVTFLGWAVGGLVIPMLVTAPSELAPFSLVKAIVVSFCFLVFLACHRSPPLRQHFDQALAPEQEQMTYGTTTAQRETALTTTVSRDMLVRREIIPTTATSIWLMLRNIPFVTQCLACGLFQSVGFTVPAVVGLVLEEQGFSERECAWLSFAFILAGVVLGVALSQVGVCKRTNRQRLVVTLFWTGSVAMLLLQLVVSFGRGQSHNLRYSMYLVLMIVAGSSSLGFVNAALPLVCETALPVPESQSGAVPELLSFLLAAALTQLSIGHGFWICVDFAIAAAMLMNVGTWVFIPSRVFLAQ